MAKDPVTPKSLINYCLGTMNWGGYNPKNRTKFRIVLGTAVMCLVFFTFILAAIYLITNSYKDFGSIMIDSIILAGYWQIIAKLWTLIIKYRLLLKLINITEFQFWSLDMLPTSDRSKIQAIYDIAKLATHSYVLCMKVTLAGYYISCYFRGKESLINSIWLPKTLRDWNRTVLGHHVIFATEAIIMATSSVSGVNMTDSIYLILIALVIAQLKIVKYKLISLTEKRSSDENMKEIAECIKHHNLLLKFLHTIEEIFSMELLHAAASIIILSVLSMYSCMVETDIGRIITYSFIFVGANSQLFIYCCMGQLVENETESVANAAYLSMWENIPDKNVRLGLLLIILRSQKYVNLTMGGFSILRLETFTKVSRTMFSLLTFMMNFDVGK